ncbi:FAD-dependent oxidoreductase [Aquibacillus sp. 3ASR75-11]|uniref:FAD-dependent oxidoreductase n=1 Tax=Terrihalobacillus insolitus TaxID=2950438 RepID=A0A9X4ALR9_9BACI|nr:FAD-dependent oxidoreductase [Terrihalobacillus insolitus]MDC3413812.1 FAD-dependent oxidoreductase [Terrihalobacillus insolitus]MDC3424541.1 FAD-dependent oxidoreductase [Terrihalobacillus insolitus]
MKADIAIIGGGIGGCMAAYTAAKLGNSVILTEETAWLGGQLTSQAVPPDEHPWIEEFGCTETYRTFRNEVRAYYEKHYPLIDKHKRLNPGNAWVSRIAHEPKVALKVLEDFLQPFISSGRLKLLLEHKARRAVWQANKITTVIVSNKDGEEVAIEADYFLDATELGDLLPLADVEYAVGAEAKQDTGEPHALDEACAEDVQPITHVFAVDFVPGEDHTIEKPEQYDFWRQYRATFLTHDQLSEWVPDVHTGESKYLPVFGNEHQLGLWDYRRIIDKHLYEEDFYSGDVTLINWPQNDYWLGSIIDVDEQDKAKHLQGARQLSLSLLYWLQTEAPREDGKKGYPEMRLRPDITGTEDGLAMHPYIRESRRIEALYTVVEQDINSAYRGKAGIKRLDDSVGIGSYRIDLHPTTVSNRLFYAKSYPFEIPLGSFIPIRVENVIPACKNIGSTQLTNGCFRLHPVEWNIGEVAGALASFAINRKMYLVDLYEDNQLVKEFQQLLIQLGVSLHWPEMEAY